ncbi:sensor histidine kinase [Streptomyces sp. NPDC054783]
MRVFPRHASLRARLLVPLLLILLVGLAGAPLFASAVIRNHLNQRADGVLERLSTSLEGLLRGQSHVAVTEQQMSNMLRSSPLVLAGLDARDHVVFTIDQRASGTATDFQPLVRTALAQPTGHVARTESGGGPYDVIRSLSPGLEVDRGGTTVHVAQLVLAMNRSQDAAVWRTVATSSTAFAVVSMVVLGGLSVWTLRRGIRPLERMADAADAVAAGGGRADFRAEADRSGAEVQRLGEALESAFDARDRAEAAVRLFMLDASHELRTPVTTLSGWLDLYAQGVLRSRADLDHAVARMESAVGRMRLLVEDLDLLARMDQGRPLDRTNTRLAPLLNGLVDDVRVIAPDRAITLQVTGDPTVRADPRRLEQVVRNLLGNAVQYTPPHTPIEVVASAHDLNAVIGIVDHGPGIPAKDLARIFDRFYRVHSTREQPGSGLGLAIVRALVEAHEGTVSASPTPDGGSTFTVRIPLAETVSEPSGTG